MLGLIGYMIGCLVVAGIVTFIVTAFRPIHGQGDSKSWHILIGSYIMVLAAPYGYAEALTQLKGDGMEEVIDDVLLDEDILGDLKYFKVLRGTGEEVRVVAVSTDDNGWGGEERAVVAMTLVRNGTEWEAIDSNVVTSFRLGHDFTTVPPYW